MRKTPLEFTVLIGEPVTKAPAISTLRVESASISTHGSRVVGAQERVVKSTCHSETFLSRKTVAEGAGGRSRRDNLHSGG